MKILLFGKRELNKPIQCYKIELLGCKCKLQVKSTPAY
jgi:hypothetical protein